MGWCLEVVSSFHEKPGTLVREEVKNMEDIVVRGVAADKGQAKVTVGGVPDKPGVAAGLFKELAKANQVNVDMIVQNVSEQRQTDISFTVPRTELAKTRKVLEGLEELARRRTSTRTSPRSASSGWACAATPAWPIRMFEALAKANINISMIATSEIKISVVIKKDTADKATQVLHKVFELEKKRRSEPRITTDFADG
jgi:aspartate kinase